MPQGLKALSFVSIYIRDHVEVIHFHIKNSNVQGIEHKKKTFFRRVAQIFI